MTEPVSVPPQGAAGEFRLDIDGARAAVTALVKVRDDLALTRSQAQMLSRQASSDRSAQDLVSVEAFALLAQKADGEPGSLGFALDAGIEHVQALIDQMSADIAVQQKVDDDAGAALRS